MKSDIMNVRDVMNKSHYCRKGRYYKIGYKEEGTW